MRDTMQTNPTQQTPDGISEDMQGVMDSQALTKATVMRVIWPLTARQTTDLMLIFYPTYRNREELD